MYPAIPTSLYPTRGIERGDLSCKIKNQVDEIRATNFFAGSHVEVECQGARLIRETGDHMQHRQALDAIQKKLRYDTQSLVSRQIKFCFRSSCIR